MNLGSFIVLLEDIILLGLVLTLAFYYFIKKGKEVELCSGF